MKGKELERLALIASWPGPLHEGHGKASYYIDSRADEKQFEALSNIITGKAGGGPFAVYASIIEEIQESDQTKIDQNSSYCDK